MRWADSSLYHTASWLDVLPHEHQQHLPRYIPFNSATRSSDMAVLSPEESISVGCFLYLKTQAQASSETSYVIKRLDSVEKKKDYVIRSVVSRDGMIRNQLKPAIRIKRRGFSSSGDGSAA